LDWRALDLDWEIRASSRGAGTLKFHLPLAVYAECCAINLPNFGIQNNAGEIIIVSSLSRDAAVTAV